MSQSPTGMITNDLRIEDPVLKQRAALKVAIKGYESKLQLR